VRQGRGDSPCLIRDFQDFKRAAGLDPAAFSIYQTRAPMIEVVCGIVEHADGRRLACLRPPGKHLGGQWEFPGGKVEPGETPDQALIRELREELGIEVEVGPALRSVEWNYPGGSIRLSPFLCRILGGTPQPIEHEEIRWCGAEALRALPWAAADVPVLEELLARNSSEIRGLAPTHTWAADGESL